MKLSSPVALLCVLVLVPIVARAESPDDVAKTRAGALVNEGNTLLEKGQADAAIEKFNEALRTYRSPKIHVNLAEAHRVAGRPAQAVRHFEIFMARGTSKPGVLRKIEARTRELEKEIARIELSGDLDGATVAIDEWRAPWRNGWRIPVNPGAHIVIVTKEGRRDFERSVEVVAGQLERLDVELVTADAAVAAADETPAIDLSPRPAAGPSGSSVVATTTRPDSEDRPLTEAWWFWAGIGGAVIAVVAIGVIAGTTGGDDTLPMGELERSSTADWGRL